MMSAMARRIDGPDGVTWTVVRRRPARPWRRGAWQVEAVSDRGEHLRWEAGGRSDARTEVDRIADLLAAGIVAPGVSTVVRETVVREAGTGEAGASPGQPTARWARRLGIGAMVIGLAGARFAFELLVDRSPSCPVPAPTEVEAMAPAWPATLVDAGPLSLEDAAGGKYGSDARRAALQSGGLVGARYQDWQVDGDVTSVRDLRFSTHAEAMGYAAVDAESICGFLESTFQPAGLPGAAGVRQPWRTGPPGWWAGAVVDDRYVRAYVRTSREDRGPDLVADGIRRTLRPGE